jgi:hypothetical protein
MPPKKQPLQEAPVIFSLRLPTDEYIPIPAESNTSYSEILSSVETSKMNERFNADTLKEILSRTKSPVYTSGTACFWCCHSFSWSACVLPVLYDASDARIQCEGNFCSPECALAYLYADIRLSDGVKWSRHTLLADMYRSLYPVKDVAIAPHRHILRMFGGQLDIEQFREFCTTSDALVGYQLPPIRLHIPNMNVHGPVRDVKKFVALSDDTVARATNELRLRRTKPAHSAVPTLDKCF